MNKLKEILNLCNHGFYIFACHGMRPDGFCTCGKVDCDTVAKHPAVTSWKDKKSKDPLHATEWYNANKWHNVAIATGKDSNLTVIDIDLKSGGLDTWASISEGLNLENACIVHTGGGGLHYYFKYNDKLKTGTNVLGQGIDVRNDGGYVIAPPSVHKSNNQYTFADVTKLDNLPELPQELIDIANANKSIKEKPQAPRTTIEKARELLKCISSENYDTWLQVGIILGREYNRSPDAFELYKEWSDSWGGINDAKRDRLLKNAFFVLSKEQANDKNISIKTLWSMALKNGYKDGKAKIPIKYFVYIAESNSFIYLINGSQWLASAVDSMCEKQMQDGEYITPSKWLINNRFATTISCNGMLPSGLIEGFDVLDGEIYNTDHGVIVNRFNQSHIDNLLQSSIDNNLNNTDCSQIYNVNLNLEDF